MIYPVVVRDDSDGPAKQAPLSSGLCAIESNDAAGQDCRKTYPCSRSHEGLSCPEPDAQEREHGDISACLSSCPRSINQG